MIKYTRPTATQWKLGCLILFLIQVVSPFVFSQKSIPSTYKALKAEAETKYGPSPDLLNGEKYYYPYRAAQGNPYLAVQGGDEGTLQINGQLYPQQKLKYDIYNQLLVLGYSNQSNAPVSIVVRYEWLDYFTLGEKLFKKFPDQAGKTRFGQVIYEGRFSCIYLWKKQYTPNLQEGVKHYEFSDPIRTAYIIDGARWSQFSGKRSFLKAFPKTWQALIKSRMKESRISIKKATDRELGSLMEYINQLPGDEG
jgi:hypothetical protein